MIDLDALVVGMLFFYPALFARYRMACRNRTFFFMPREEMPPQLPLMVRLEKI